MSNENAHANETGAEEAKPIDVTLPYENALHDLLRKVMPGLDSGDILADAKTASDAIAVRNMTDPQIDAIWANLDARGSSLYEPHQWQIELRRRFARDILARSPATAAAPPADEQAALPRYAEWLHLRTHGEWSNGVPAWARDYTGRMNDFTAATAVIEELAARAAASPDHQESSDDQ
ncbi:hypothetical protein WK78_29015 [Burkholderia cepacia]|uniref:hypothetical protein n=1 Tax=Burkholderia cepacia TaxID=292 RepID=UPI00075B684F|nr:hypothetical protein [Burkholderia cepacia]KVV20328.1 hypothetical protein WK78_29015 [Burkholderia cepacia]